MQEDTVWLTQKAIGQLFDIDRSVVTKHLKKIFTDGELEENSTCAFFAQAARYGKYAVRPADEAERQECMERLKEAEGDIKWPIHRSVSGSRSTYRTPTGRRRNIYGRTVQATRYSATPPAKNGLLP